jgi:trimeric autotransporter adhesin
LGASAKRLVLAGLVLGLVVFALGFARVANAAPGDIGFEGPSTTSAGSGPTGTKPESKLWWNDGYWWASMWDTGTSDFHIFKLDPGAQTWSDTGVRLDDRSGTHADVLWDAGSGKLYVASHQFSESSGSGSASRLYRLGYDPATDTYTPDPGFPVSINNYKTEALVIAKDSTGQLWATWRQGTAILVNSTVCNPACDDKTWGTPFVLDSAVSSDDISSVIAFGGDKIGVMWSDQSADRDSFGIHADSAPDTTWTTETALQGPGMADDHINLKTDSTGRVFAGVKTSKGGSTDPLNMLLTRSPAGSWSSAVFGLKRDHHTRPIIELDETNGVIHMFATAPESGGIIYEKSSPVSAISFPTGLGTPVLKDADSQLNNVTSTKQNVNTTTGLVVVASGPAGHYFHNFVTLGGGGGGPVKPTANFTGAPTTGTAPLTVQFTDSSANGPTNWQWDFQNDGTIDSNLQSPQFTYTSPGTYSVKLIASNTAGSDTLTRTGYITVGSAGGGGSVTLKPTDDAYVRLDFPDENTGSQTTVRTYRTDQTMSYLRFDATGVTGPISNVKIRLWVTDASNVAGSIYSVENTTWSEGAITYNTRPTVGNLLGAGGAAPLGTWVVIDLGAVNPVNGVFSFALKDGGSDAVRYSSSETANSPELIVTFGS